MKKKIKVGLFILILCISAIFCTNTFAVTKTDIIDYVNSQQVCGDVGLFNTYKTTLTRLLKQKRLSETQLDTIYSYLESSVGILNNKGVCKISDLDKLTSSEKSTVYNSLKAGAGIITSAPMLEFGEKDESVTDNNTNISVDNTQTNVNNKEQGTKVTINTQDNTIDIYENGVLVDKVVMSLNKMTYTGVNITHLVIVVVCVFVFGLALTIFIFLAKKHKAKYQFAENILISLMICSSIIGLIVAVFSDKIDSLIGIVDMVSFNSSNKEIEVELNADKSIKTYPSYGANYATLKIPSLNIENNVYFGDITSILSVGVGHSTWSDMPTENGVVVYSGHNKKNMLNGLKEIAKGNKIIVDTSYATCTYEVIKTSVLKDTEVDKLTKINDKETLIVYTCYPFDTYVYTNDRFVVYSVLKEISWK